MAPILSEAVPSRALPVGLCVLKGRLRTDPEGDALPCDAPEPIFLGGTSEDSGASSSSSVVACSSSSASLSVCTTERGLERAKELVNLEDPGALVGCERATDDAAEGLWSLVVEEELLELSCVGRRTAVALPIGPMNPN